MRWRWLGLLMLGACGPAVDPGDPEQGGSSGGQESSEASTSNDEASAGTSPGTTSDGPTSTSSSPTTGPSTTVDPGSTGPSESSSDGSSGDPPEFEPICAGDGQFEFSASGVNQAEHEGRLVWASAVEPDVDGKRVPDVIVVLQQDTIEGGAFELSCADGLTENFAYPSLAVVLDADDNGACSDGDLAFTMQLFGWNTDQIYAFDGTSVVAQADPPWEVTGDAWQPIADMPETWGMPFCDYYFD